MSIIESLRKLVDPIAARQKEAERIALRETPVREEAAAPPLHECRVCGYIGVEPDFCPDCLAQTMRPTTKGKAKAAPAAGADAPEAVSIPVDGTLDLHTFAPSEVQELLTEYLADCAARGLRHVRVVHGKGTGKLKRTVERALAREPLVEAFGPADEGAGGWGATLVRLRSVSEP
jgi:hypothetical protein